MKEMGKWRKAGAEQSLPQRPHLNKLLLSPRSLLRPRGLKGPWHQLGPRVRRSRVRRSRPPQRPGRRKTRVSSGRSGGPNCPRDPSRRPARGPSSAGGWGRDSGSDIRRSFPSPRHSAHLPGHPRSGEGRCQTDRQTPLRPTPSPNDTPEAIPHLPPGPPRSRRAAGRVPEDPVSRRGARRAVTVIFHGEVPNFECRWPFLRTPARPPRRARGGHADRGRTGSGRRRGDSGDGGDGPRGHGAKP